MIKNEAKEKLSDIELKMSLAMAYNDMGMTTEAKEIYEKIILINRKQAEALNNLAWLLLTEKNPHPADIKRGFELAKESVALERSPDIPGYPCRGLLSNG